MENQPVKERNIIQKKQYLWLAIAILVILAGSFYWFQYRPSKARKGCSDVIAGKQAEAKRLYASENCDQQPADGTAGWKVYLDSDEYKKSVRCKDYKDKMTNSSKVYDDDFKSCLREKGISN